MRVTTEPTFTIALTAAEARVLHDLLGCVYADDDRIYTPVEVKSVVDELHSVLEEYEEPFRMAGYGFSGSLDYTGRET